MKIIAFVGETFEKNNDSYFAKPTSAAFLQNAIGKDNVYVASSFNSKSTLSTNYSTQVDKLNFYEFPHYSSTKDFAIKVLTKKNFLKEYQNYADEIIKKHTGSFFWIRTPSIGSIVFGLRVLKANQKLLHHMCADASNTWKDKKYSFYDKIIGYLFSRIIRLLLAKICRHENTINLCTGDVLENFSKKYSPLKTYQFVDLMSQKLNNNNQKNKDINSDNFNLAFIGRLVEDKGIFVLLKAINNLPKNVILNIVGGGESYREVTEFIKKNNLHNRVFLHGQLSFSELSVIYKETDLTIIPSNNYYEGFPRVIMESWSHNVPVIVSNVGGINAFVKDKVNGLIMQPGNSKELEELINLTIKDKNIYHTIKNGAIDMEKYSTFEYWSNKMLAIINENKNET